MQENNKNVCNCGSGSKCCGSMCSGWCGQHHIGFHVLRWVLAIIIITMVFSVGIKVGEFKAEFIGNSHHNYRQMYSGQRMMHQNSDFGLPQ